MATHSSTLGWKIPWMEEPGRLLSMESLRVGHDWATSLSLKASNHDPLSYGGSIRLACTNLCFSNIARKASIKVPYSVQFSSVVSEPQICRWHHPYGRKWRGSKKPLDESESGEWKSWLKVPCGPGNFHVLSPSLPFPSLWLSIPLGL